jgi:hypothetical protein
MRLVAKVLFLLVLIVGCQEVGSATTAPVALRITGRLRDEPPVSVEGAQVCQVDTANCVLTDDRGEATIELPSQEEIAYTIEKEGYDSLLIAQVIPASGSTQVWGLTRVETIAELHESLMSTYPRVGAGEIFILVSPARAGATFDLIGATGKQWYNVGPLELSTEPEATTSIGWGGFYDVPPGTHRVQFGGNAMNCVPRSGWPDVENGIRVPVQENHNSFIDVTCPLP